MSTSEISRRLVNFFRSDNIMKPLIPNMMLDRHIPIIKKGADEEDAAISLFTTPSEASSLLFNPSKPEEAISALNSHLKFNNSKKAGSDLKPPPSPKHEFNFIRNLRSSKL